MRSASASAQHQLEHLSRATLRLMTTVLRPLGEALTKMPVGLAGQTAGPGFGYNRDVHLLPHKPSAWVFFGERLRGLALTAARLRQHAGVPPEVDEAAAALEDLATQFAPTAGVWNGAVEVHQFARIDTGTARVIRPELNGPYLVTSVDNLVNSRGEPLAARPRMALCRCGGSANKPFCDGTHARTGFTSAGPDRVTGGIQIPDEPRAEGASGEHYALCRCGCSRNKPFCDGTHWYIKFRDDKN